MNSLKTKSDNYTLIDDKAIAGVVLVPIGNTFTIYVAWEWEIPAKNKFFAIVKCDLIPYNQDIRGLISRSANYGFDVTHDIEARKLFPLLF